MRQRVHEKVIYICENDGYQYLTVETTTKDFYFFFEKTPHDEIFYLQKLIH